VAALTVKAKLAGLWIGKTAGLPANLCAPNAARAAAAAAELDRAAGTGNYSNAQHIGVVTPANEREAIKAAIEQFGIEPARLKLTATKISAKYDE
jgi:hypothetical protein